MNILRPCCLTLIGIGVYTADIKKLFSWYNQLLAAGIVEFVAKEDEPSATEAE